MRKPKICQECKWFEHHPPVERTNLDRCTNPKTFEVIPEQVSLVTGEVVPEHYRHNYSYCEIQRKRGWLDACMLHYCGKRGRWFEPRDDAPDEVDSDAEET